MKKSNYALISALYSNKTKGLYSDIYFPIIKYAIVELFAQDKNTNHYFSADDIHNFIQNTFGVMIPNVVITKSVMKIQSQKQDEIELTIYEDGNSFQISNATYSSTERTIKEREQLFTKQIELIEKQYREFLEREGCYDDGVTFIQFISDNTDDILGYFEDNDINNVNEKYATMVFFLEYLSEYNSNLYQAANQLFWGSIIAGFLQSERPQVNEEEKGVKNEYFLDTSIIMGLLELSTPHREALARDVCDIITSAGGILRVHPMTVDEVSFILQSVEQNGPDPLTDIASAFSRRELDTHALAKIRINLTNEIERRKINVFPPMNPVEKNKAIQALQGKRIVQLLGESRNKKPSSYSNDKYREIHDIFMDNYIKERRNSKGVNQVFFLTSNSDLIEFCNKMHPSENNMISTGRVILELWMHNTKSADISSYMLTETMARCLDMHNSTIRNKIVTVSRYYNRTKDCFDPEIYKDFIKHLYRRAKNVILAVDNTDEKLGSGMVQLISEAVAADNLHYDSETAKIHKSNKQLQENIESKEAELKSKDEQIANLSKDKENLADRIEDQDVKIKQVASEKEKAEETISLYKRRDILNNEISDLTLELKPYEESLKKAFCNWQPVFFYVLSAILFILGLMLLFKPNFMPNLFTSKSWPFISVSIMIAIFLVNLGNRFSDSTDDRRQKAYDKWRKKPQNAKYNKLKSNLIEKEKELDLIKEKLHAAL